MRVASDGVCRCAVNAVAPPPHLRAGPPRTFDPATAIRLPLGLHSNSVAPSPKSACSIVKRLLCGSEMFWRFGFGVL